MKIARPFCAEIASLKKPRLFIGSSREGRYSPARSKQTWTATRSAAYSNRVLFELSVSTFQQLLKAVETSDFGVYVCSADDVTAMRGISKAVARDNVLLELGMFMGSLRPAADIFLDTVWCRPSSSNRLASITSWHFYEAQRSDGAWRQATGPFCSEVRTKIENEGFRRKEHHERLDNLAVAYTCCVWIPRQGAIRYRAAMETKKQYLRYDGRRMQMRAAQPPSLGRKAVDRDAAG